MDTNYKPVDISNHRREFNAHAKISGHRLFTIERANIDPEYLSKMKDAEINGHLLTHRPVKLYKLIAKDISAVSIADCPDGVRRIIFNNDSTLQFPIVLKPSYEEPITPEILSKALKNYEDPNCTEVIWFADGEKLASEIRALNNAEVSRINTVIADLTNASLAIKDVNISINDSMERYKRETIGLNEATISIEVAVGE